MKLLPLIAGRPEYASAFPESELWLTAVREIARLHGLPQELARGEAGQGEGFPRLRGRAISVK